MERTGTLDPTTKQHRDGTACGLMPHNKGHTRNHCSYKLSLSCWTHRDKNQCCIDADIGCTWGWALWRQLWHDSDYKEIGPESEKLNHGNGSFKSHLKVMSFKILLDHPCHASRFRTPTTSFHNTGLHVFALIALKFQLSLRAQNRSKTNPNGKHECHMLSKIYVKTRDGVSSRRQTWRPKPDLLLACEEGCIICTQLISVPEQFNKSKRTT